VGGFTESEKVIGKENDRPPKNVDRPSISSGFCVYFFLLLRPGMPDVF
jgi:hypothetical protein